jgi:hypothetical protein
MTSDEPALRTNTTFPEHTIVLGIIRVVISCCIDLSKENDDSRSTFAMTAGQDGSTLKDGGNEIDSQQTREWSADRRIDGNV